MSKNLYSPSMFKNFLSCNYIIFNEFHEKDLNLKRKQKTISDEKRLEKGNIHEEDYFKVLKKKYSKVIDIKNLEISKDQKFKKTLECMEQGYEIIRGGYLKDEKWRGEFDFLEINKDLKSNFGNYSYEVIDTKNTNKVKPDHDFQVGLYCYLLEKAQGVLPKNFYIVLKSMEKKQVALKDMYLFFLKTKKKYEHFVDNDIDKSQPEKCSFCEICPWIENCTKIWKDNDSLDLLWGIRKPVKKKLYNVGIKTIAALAKYDVKKNKTGVTQEILERYVKISKLKQEQKKTGKPAYEIIEENLSIPKGFNLLAKPSKCDLFFDMESVQDYVVDGKLEYLFGIYYVENGEEKFEALWSHNKEEEKKNVIKFFDFTKKHFDKYPDSKIYHYAPYEKTALERLTSTHKVKHVEYDHYLHEGRFIDLFTVTKQAIYSSEDYSIKDVEKLYEFVRTGDVRKATASEDFYIEWLESKNQKLLDEIEHYNKQDCRSTYELREWLLKIKPTNTTWFVPEKEHKDYSPRELMMLDYQERINNAKIKDQNLKQIVSDILGFFNRENKPDWREYFERKNLSHAELMDNIECIGDMRLVKQPVKEVRSLIYTYKYEDQEFKLRAGKTVTLANHLGSSDSSHGGTIVDIDHLNRIVILKKGIGKNNLPSTISIGPRPPYSVDNLEDSTYRFINSLIANNRKYKAIVDFITKKIPDIKGVKSGDKIIISDDFLKEIPKIISNLDNSYLYIQGPPGTGKTYQAAHAIVQLIKSGKKVGITANSHKVIHNLIERVELWAEKLGVKFKGLKRGSKDDEDTNYAGDFVTTSSNDLTFIRGLNNSDENEIISLYAGTKFHFSNNYYDEKLDYLFFDEAGQLSVADLVATGSAAKNLVLLGDQNQLGQPIRGSHPGESGKSILDFLLEDKETIPENKGIFLNKTYRLNSKINDFISNNFYEGRLIVDEKNNNRKIIYKKGSTIQSDGIHYLEMNHEDRIQSCDEETQIVKKLMKELIGSEFIDKDNKSRKLTIEDILVISPYNAQVNYLLARLDKGAKVGTIDKFQGQEAPVTIISMTSSDAESLPRNKAFFFSRNRLNVAISRAQCVSVILFNPQLLETSPTTEEQMRLLNNFCKILQYNNSNHIF